MVLTMSFRIVMRGIGCALTLLLALSAQVRQGCFWSRVIERSRRGERAEKGRGVRRFLRIEYIHSSKKKKKKKKEKNNNFRRLGNKCFMLVDCRGNIVEDTFLFSIRFSIRLSGYPLYPRIISYALPVFVVAQSDNPTIRRWRLMESSLMHFLTCSTAVLSN